jgi:hypothetical protein
MIHNERFEELVALQALGIPLGAEGEEFSRHLAECPVCEQMLKELQDSASVLAASAPPIQPRAEIRKRLLASLDAAPAVGLSRLPSETRAGGADARRPASPWLFAAAASLLLVLSLWDDARLRRERESLRGENAEMSGRVASAEKALARRDLQVRVLDSDDVKMLALGGKQPQRDARGKVFWSARAKRGVLLAANLASLPPNKQYELWVFSKGKPVAAGVFDADASGRALFESSDLSEIDAAQNFAVTVEPRGGVTAPTGPIVLAGAP